MDFFHRGWKTSAGTTLLSMLEAAVSVFCWTLSPVMSPLKAWLRQHPKFLPSRVCVVLNLVAIPKSADTMKRTALPSGSIWKLTTKCNIKTIRLSPQISFFFSLSPFFNFFFGVPLCHSGRNQQLVTPYGREWRGCFEQLPAWTPPYAVEFDCLLSLINEKSDAMLLAISVHHLFSPSRGRCSNPHLSVVLFFQPPHRLPVMPSKFCRVCKTPAWVFRAWAASNPVMLICLWWDNAEGDCSTLGFLIISAFVRQGLANHCDCSCGSSALRFGLF